MKKPILLFLSFITVTACDKKSTTETVGDKIICPTLKPNTYFKINVDSPGQDIPGHIKIVANDDVIYDECGSTVFSPPIVEVKKASNHLTIKASYYSSEEEPGILSLKIVDMGSCSATETNFFEFANSTLEYKKYYPYGKNCVVHDVAELSYTK